MKNRPLIIIGAGGHGRVVSDIAVLVGYRQIFFLDDADVPGMNVVGRVSDFEKYIDGHDFFVAIGNNAVRKDIFDRLYAAGAEMVSLCHPDAVIGKNVVIGKGVAVMAGVVINNGAMVEDGAVLNTCSSVDHDCHIGRFAHIAVGAHLAGTVLVGEETLVGAGASVINNISLCSHCVIGAGAVVVKSITGKGTYVGIPAQMIG